ncbi:MAG: ribosome recycling factor [Clostridia bacterium]|nr:ribosome recycling factor [Clostridia bacterium]
MLNEYDKSLYDGLNAQLQKSLDHLNSELGTVRAGRANPRLLDKIMVNYYGTMTPLKQMANISAPDPRTIAISLWDISQLKEVLKAIQASDLGLNPSDDGKVIRLFVPAPTEERRIELVKMVKKFCEDTKVTMRNARRECLDVFKKLKNDKKITEDELKQAENEVQKILNNFTDKADQMLAQKEKEITEV